MSLPTLLAPPSDLARVDRLTEVSDDLCEDFLRVYRAAFAPLETLAAARQALTDEEFRDEMTDPRVVKFVARDESGAACALAFMALDLSIVPWVSVPYYAKRFPDHFARGAIFYVGALLVRAERQGGPWVKVIVDDMVRYVAEHQAIAAFDCCGFNTDVIKLPETLARSTHRLAYAETMELDSQRYYAYEMAGLR
jgi:hypothetical protein